MTPLLFGPASRQLFGSFHPAHGDTHADRAVLICPPFGQEAIASHRLWRALADRLARSGFAVLRFDYHGTGDSPGDDADGEFDGWRRDICTAHEELRRRTGAQRIVWLGARLGASLAVLAAKSGRSDPARLVLWDPIVSGRDHLQWLRERHVEALEASFCVPDPDWRRQLATNPRAFTDELLGFAVSPTLLLQLHNLGADSLQLTALHETLVLAPDDDAVVRRWCETEASRRMPVRYSPFKHPLRWSAEPQPGNALVPAEALQRLATFVT